MSPMTRRCEYCGEKLTVRQGRFCNSRCTQRAHHDLAPCGTKSALQRHRRNHEPLDDLCAALAPGSTPLAPCGTASAAHRHYRNGEELDDACAQAIRDEAVARRARARRREQQLRRAS